MRAGFSISTHHTSVSALGRQVVVLMESLTSQVLLLMMPARWMNCHVRLARAAKRSDALRP